MTIDRNRFDNEKNRPKDSTRPVIGQSEDNPDESKRWDEDRQEQEERERERRSSESKGES